MLAQKRIDPETARMALARVPTDVAQLPAFKREMLLHALSAEKQVEMKFENVDLGDRRLTIAYPATGGAATEVPGSQFAVAAKPINGGDGAGSGKPDAWGKRVDPNDPNKTVLVPLKMKDGVYQEVPTAGGITPAPQSEVNVIGPQTAGLTPAQTQQREMPTIKEQAKLDANYGTAKAGINNTTRGIDNSIALIDEIINDPSLDRITGKVNRMMLPTTRAESVALENKFNTLKEKGWIQSLINLRTAGGRIGGASDQEGRRIADSLGAFSLDMNPEQLIPALEKYKSDLEYSRQNLLDAFDETYAYKSGGGSAGGVVDFNSLP